MLVDGCGSDRGMDGEMQYIDNMVIAWSAEIARASLCPAFSAKCKLLTWKFSCWSSYNLPHSSELQRSNSFAGRVRLVVEARWLEMVLRSGLGDWNGFFGFGMRRLMSAPPTAYCVCVGSGGQLCLTLIPSCNALYSTSAGRWLCLNQLSESITFLSRGTPQSCIPYTF